MTSKNETTNSPIHEFKVLNMSFKAIKMKDHGLNVSKVINKKQITVKKGFQKAFIQHF